MGADGAATLGALGQQTIRQSTTKLYTVNHCVVVGVSGPVGLGQRIVGEIEAVWTGKKLSGKKPTEAMTLLRLQLWNNVLNVEHQVAAVAKNSIGQLALQDTLASTLLALPLSNAPCLIQFDQQGAPELADDNLPFVAIGSGQAIADPFLAFIRRIFWANTVPAVQDGIFAALWTLRHAIETNPGGVSEPIEICVLSKDGKDCKAKKLTEPEYEEHNVAIEAAELSLKKFREALTGTSTDPEVSPPA